MFRQSPPRKSHRYVIAGTAAASLLLMTACSSGTSQAGGEGEQEQVNLTVTTTIGGPEDYHNVPIDELFTAIEEESDGRISYEFNYVNSIVPPAEVGSAMASGTVDAGLVVTSYNPAEYPVSNWLSQLAFAGEAGPPAAALERSAAVAQWWTEHPEAIESDFTTTGLVPLTAGINAHTAYHLLCTEEITSLEDAQGKTVRTPGVAWADTAEALGMEPVSLPGAEIYESLQRGIVDCIMADAPDMVSSNLTEVADHYTMVNLPGFTPYGIFISKQEWDALDEELKDIVWAELEVYVESLTDEGLQLQLEFFEAEGVEFHEMEDDLAGALAEHQESVVADAIDSAPEGIADPQAAVDSFQSLHEEWAGVLESDLGVESAETWAAWHEAGGSPDDIDLDAYAELVNERVFEGKRPE